MKALWHMILANLKMTMRNRSALFWLLAFPVLFIVLFGYLFDSGGFGVEVGVVGADRSSRTAQVVDEMKKVDGFTVRTGDRDAELAALREDERDIVVIFGPGEQTDQMAAQIYFDQSNPQTSQLAVSAIQQFFSQANQGIT